MTLEPDERWLGGRRPTMRPPTRIQSRAALIVVSLAVGFLVAIQATEGAEDRVSRLAAESPEDLTRILADLNQEADELGHQVSALRVRLERYRGSAQSDDLVLRDARDSLADLQVLTGVVPVEGPGLAVTLSDPEGRIEWDALLDLVQELRDAGAEAIAVNGRRVIASTWFGPSEVGVVLDGEELSPAYRIEVIGPAGGIAEALQIPGGSLNILSAQLGVSARIRQADELTLPPASKEVALEHAQPVA